MVIFIVFKIAKKLFVVFDIIVLLLLLFAVRAFKWTFRIGRRYR